jgi:hypothetical protein
MLEYTCNFSSLGDWSRIISSLRAALGTKGNALSNKRITKRKSNNVPSIEGI